jgi:hypothetical protein
MIKKPRSKKAAKIVAQPTGHKSKGQEARRETSPQQERSQDRAEDKIQDRVQERAHMSSETTTTKAPTTAAAERPPTQIRYLDRADMGETFADSISGLIFDGQTLRIEFAVTRFDEVKPNTPISGRRYPACRLVLPPAAAVDLINRMQQVASALTQAGVVKPAAPRAATAKAD